MATKTKEAETAELDATDTEAGEARDEAETLTDAEESIEDGAGTEDTGLDSPLEGEDQDTQGSPPDEAKMLAGMGLDKYRSVDHALQGLVEAQKLIGQRDYYSQIGQQFAPHAQRFQEWLSAQAQPKAPEPAWNPPHPWDERMQRLEAIALAGGDPWTALPESERRMVTDYLGYRNNWWATVMNDPSRLTQIMGRQMEGIVQTALADRDRKTTAQAFVQRNRDLIQDPMGYRELDSLLGSGVPGEYAEEIVRLRMKVRDLGGEADTVAAGKRELEEKKQQLRSKASLRGKRSAQASVDFDVTKMSRDEIRRAVEEMDEAGVLE